MSYYLALGLVYLRIIWGALYKFILRPLYRFLHWIFIAPPKRHYHTPEYDRYLKSREWQEIRQRRLRYDHNRCVYCGSKKGLQVNHKNYANLGHERLEDLETVCVKHHKIVDAKRRSTTHPQGWWY